MTNAAANNDRNETATADAPPRDFIRERVAEDLAADRAAGRSAAVRTRFPPEPNGHLHIGHAKSICLNFGIAGDFGGACNLRFDDTNPLTEETEYVEAIERDVRWLGFDWDELHYASDYFEQIYDWAVELIRAGKAYVDSVTADQVGALRGLWHEEGKASPFRDRPVEESLDLFARMRRGEFPDGAHVLRARIDMSSGNMNLRDPVMYRIRHARHHRTGPAWCVYPTYDWAHGQSDAIEGITHSICTLEFEDHRPLYDWYLEQLAGHLPVAARPQQIEFARLSITYTVLSKRKLLELVRGGYVQGWDDPRMPTLSGLRRRGYTPEAIRDFCDRIGVTKNHEAVVDLALLEHCLRDDLNRRAERRMGVLRPLRVVIENYPEGQVEQLEAVNNPEDASAGTRQVPFSRVFYIEREDFLEDAPKGFFRLSPGREVRLRYAYFVTCVGVTKDEQGEVTELRCTYDPETRGGNAPDGRKVKATLHWVSEAHAVDGEVRLYGSLFSVAEPDAVEGDWKASLDPASLEVLHGCKLEPALARATPGELLQLERVGYFCVDPDSTAAGKPVLNRSVGLRDAWAKAKGK
ncbi:MAG TPA: glutamine--tRNA ligase/YqeY domain fusion protein [Thermoanaerobaculia bacterium]|nr:glutamine--tRNA ligase/YqeY domain fusion protein [Thermoanaerobaculia bacterium]